MSILSELEAKASEYAEWRHAFHEHPEIGLDLEWTAARVAEKLRGWGIEVAEGIGRTGLVGVIRGDLGEGRTIALRSDMDALPMQETGECPWKSRQEGAMHGCGHDGHMTMLLAAAQYLAAHRQFRGTVLLVFQPGEEGADGANQMIRDGLFERFPCDEIYGMHNWTDIPVGEVRLRKGATMSGQDFFSVKIRGRGAHGSAPQLSADAAMAAALITTALQQIVSRNVAPLDVAVVSVTKIHAGSAFNIIPEEAELGGCTRFFSDETGALLRRRIEVVARTVGASCGVEVVTVFTPIAAVLMSDDKLAEAMREAVEEVVGEGRAAWSEQPQMASEDFSYLVREVPGAYCFLGGHAPYAAKNLHNPKFDFDDRVLATGAAIWVTVAMKRLAAQG